jgi:putative hydrolase of the HAD superfamily
VKTIFFDFGNVIGFFDHTRAIERLAAHTDLSPAEIDAAVYHRDSHTAYESGQLSTDEFVRRAIEVGKLRCSPGEFERMFADIFWRNDDVCDLLPGLAKNYRLVLASNTCDAHYRALCTQFAPELAHFRARGASHEAGARKPHPAFYAYCQALADAPPGECLFVDDLEANVLAGRAHGWHAVRYPPGARLRDVLTPFGIQFG